MMTLLALYFVVGAHHTQIVVALLPVTFVDSPEE